MGSWVRVPPRSPCYAWKNRDFFDHRPVRDLRWLAILAPLVGNLRSRSVPVGAPTGFSLPDGAVYISFNNQRRVSCPENRTTDKRLMLNSFREASDLPPDFSAIDFLGTFRFLPSFSGC
jgi:hypothetical protein